MTVSRRSFMGALLAAACAPAIVKASSLMPIYVPKIILPSYLTLWGDGLHDDQPAIQALLAGGLVADQMGQLITQSNGAIYLPKGTYAIGSPTFFSKSSVPMVIQGGNVLALPTFPTDKALFYMDHDNCASITDCSFVGNVKSNAFPFAGRRKS